MSLGEQVVRYLPEDTEYQARTTENGEKDLPASQCTVQGLKLSPDWASCTSYPGGYAWKEIGHYHEITIKKVF